MANWPTLSRGPAPSSFSETKAYDPSLRSQVEDGEVISRARFTANKKLFRMRFEYLTSADKILLDAFQDTVMVGADTFNFTNEDQNDATTYTVRLVNPIIFRIVSGNTLQYTAEVVLMEA